MKDKLNTAFQSITATDELKQKTLANLPLRQQKKRKPATKIIYGIACAFACLLFIAYSTYYSKAAYVDIDVNPSLELTVNPFQRIIDVKAYNADGEEILTKLSLKNKSYQQAVNLLVAEFSQEELLTPDAQLAISVQTKKKNAEKWQKNLEKQVTTSLAHHQQTVNYQVFEIDEATKTAATIEAVTPARYLAIKELQELDETASFETCRHHSLSEIYQEIDNCHQKRQRKQNGNGKQHKEKTTDSATESKTNNTSNNEHHREQHH
ncbi:hypothetical protein M2139_000407 [Enterococcus sp. PF1-24]|uniref:anti-sigma-I factor RsgI family protein n=1 Tax=unclassified Enterococcus TaxID=2608891 RepID=UPI002473B953|nr:MULTISPECIES: hypothetical protein [unclassified Enterococcus]MDH6363432.1 hypothetical protein [Enterococcus sp. PFB1-1]MDH6400526.1 hypothetical protein [Enterococcus sp. PF1-24]